MFSSNSPGMHADAVLFLWGEIGAPTEREFLLGMSGVWEAELPSRETGALLSEVDALVKETDALLLSEGVREDTASLPCVGEKLEVKVPLLSPTLAADRGELVPTDGALC